MFILMAFHAAIFFLIPIHYFLVLNSISSFGFFFPLTSSKVAEICQLSKDKIQED